MAGRGGKPLFLKLVVLIALRRRLLLRTWVFAADGTKAHTEAQGTQSREGNGKSLSGSPSYLLCASAPLCENPAAGPTRIGVVARSAWNEALILEIEELNLGWLGRRELASVHHCDVSEIPYISGAGDMRILNGQG